MKYLNTFKKNISGFKPELHWKVIMVVNISLFFLSVGYNVYLYVYAQRQIRSAMLTESSETIATTSFASPLQIQESFEIYKNREIRYYDIMGGLIDMHKVSPTIATSSKQ